MSSTLRTIAELDRAGLLSGRDLSALERVADSFAVSVTSDLVELIDRADPDDPIALQFIPSAAELDRAPEERSDPIGDEAYSPVRGIVHRYADRVLLKAVEICPVYCRFCFRRETVGHGSGVLEGADLDAAIRYIAETPTIWEVILTGGDPLILSPRRLAELRERLEQIPHLGVLRIHSRVPVTDPSRIDAELVAALKGRLPVFVMLHANHPRELTEAARAACARLVDAGIPMLGQSVLLKGINDDVGTLTALFRAMVETRVKPHYLHHGDLAPGTAQFRTEIAAGQALMQALRGPVSGLCQPSYMLDIPGGAGKVPVGPTYLRRQGGTWRVTDPMGCEHVYPPLQDES